jgi:large subunit ribosomal protein L17
MKHGYFGRKLGRNKDERRRLFMILTRSLIGSGRVRTTLAKAKSIQPMVEKLITKAKSGESGALRKASMVLADVDSYKKLLVMAKERFAKRTSGYTRIVKLGTRLGDASEMVYLEFVDSAPVVEKPKKQAVKKGEKEIQEAEVVTEEPKTPVKKAKTEKKVKADK